jgi:signal peptidase II
MPVNDKVRTIDWLALARNPQNWMWGFPLSIAIIAADQVSKTLVLAQSALNGLACRDGLLPCGAFQIVGPVFNDKPFFSISMTWNRGVSFGALQSEGAGRWLLFLLTGAIAAGFAVWLFKAVRPLTALSLSMVIGGAVGNLIDRAMHGAVVDFLDFSGLFFPWVFNIADASISLGALMLLLDQLLASRKSPL